MYAFLALLLLATPSLADPLVSESAPLILVPQSGLVEWPDDSHVARSVVLGEPVPALATPRAALSETVGPTAPPTALDKLEQCVSAANEMDTQADFAMMPSFELMIARLCLADAHAWVDAVADRLRAAYPPSQPSDGGPVHAERAPETPAELQRRINFEAWIPIMPEVQP